MAEIHVITRENRAYYADILTSYYRKRHDIFVGERKWMSLFSPDGLERDQYDNEHTIYILALEGEEVVGGQRLYPTLQPHMITETFMHLIDGALPVGSRTFEWTRYFVIRERRRGHVDAMLLAAVQQYCLEEGITDLTAVGEMWWLSRWHQYGFVVHPLGLPQMIDGQPALAVKIAISEDTLSTVLRVGGIKETALTRRVVRPRQIGQMRDAA